jgi:hypothetical protein
MAIEVNVALILLMLSGFVAVSKRVMLACE